jgi:hypothetical protein
MKIKNIGNSAVGKMTIWMVVALIVAVLVIYDVSNNLSKSNISLDNTVLQDKIAMCNKNVRDRLGDKYDVKLHDKDDDGVIDECQVCFAMIDQDDFRKISWVRNMFGGHNLETRTSLISKNSKDTIGDGILDACDSNTAKASKPALGFIGNTVATECRKIEKASGDKIKAIVSDKHGYTTCSLEFVG